VPAEDPERELWELAKRRDNVPSYEAYLRVFPQGRFAAIARAALDGLRPGAVVQAAAPSPSPQVAPLPDTRRTGDAFKDCAECPEMVVIPAGRFLMGSPAGEAGRDSDEGPQSLVDVPRFAMGKFEVTQGQWQAVMGRNPSTFRACGPDCPVENVSWNDAQEFARRLSQRTGQNYLLPSEAEWEYAARAGTTTAYHWGERAGREHANYGADACCGGRAEGRDLWVETAPVGQFPANAFGLHDMHGNVYEWVQDVSHSSYAGAPNDGSAWMTDGDPSRRVLRGGSWNGTPQDLRSADRVRGTPDDRYGSTGFRIARNF
jgi:formylglycine-generating enzyme required for sulfatase activity